MKIEAVKFTNVKGQVDHYLKVNGVVYPCSKALCEVVMNAEAKEAVKAQKEEPKKQ